MLYSNIYSVGSDLTMAYISCCGVSLIYKGEGHGTFFFGGIDHNCMAPHWSVNYCHPLERDIDCKFFQYVSG